MLRDLFSALNNHKYCKPDFSKDNLAICDDLFDHHNLKHFSRKGLF